MTIALIILAIIWATGTVVTFLYGLAGYLKNRDIWEEEARQSARTAMHAPAWPITLARLIREAHRYARN